MNSLTTIIITKNEEGNIVDAIENVKFSNQIIVVDAQSRDRTVEVAKKAGAEVIVRPFENFSEQREAGLDKATGDLIFYLDADERVSEKLRREIKDILEEDSEFDVFQVKRQNYYFKKYPWPYVAKFERLFKRSALKGWTGDIHESPVYEGKVVQLSGILTHYTHNDLTSMTEKTINWSDKEAKIRLDAKHPKMSAWRFPRVMIPVFFNYYIKQRGYKLGTAGLIESIFQTYSTFITYAKLWESQNK